jgi:hypothetical protein
MLVQGKVVAVARGAATKPKAADKTSKRHVLFVPSLFVEHDEDGFLTEVAAADVWLEAADGAKLRPNVAYPCIMDIGANSQGQTIGLKQITIDGRPVNIYKFELPNSEEIATAEFNEILPEKPAAGKK